MLTSEGGQSLKMGKRHFSLSCGVDGHGIETGGLTILTQRVKPALVDSVPIKGHSHNGVAKLGQHAKTLLMTSVVEETTGSMLTMSLADSAILRM